MPPGTGVEGTRAGPFRSGLVGVIFGVDAVGHCLALATICFGGALVSGLGPATGIFVIGSAIATLALFCFGRIKPGLAISQDTTISILAPAVFLAAGAVTGPTEAMVATALAVIGMSAMLSGLLLWLIGRLGLGRLVRMFPFSVTAGFLASSGYLLVFAALSLLTHETGFAQMLTAAADPLVEMRLLPAVIMAVVMFLAIRFVKGPGAVIVTVLVSLAGFYVVCSAMGLSVDEAVALGLLPPRQSPQDSGLDLTTLGMIDWSAVLQVMPVMAAVVFLNLLGMLLNLTGVELATRADIDENRELRITGLSNLLIGLFGGLTAFLQGGASIILAKIGVDQKPLILGYISTMVLAAFMADVLVAFVPVFIPAALLIFIGISMLEDWLFATRKRLLPFDWAIVVIIVLATAIVGILPAIGIGIALALVGFAYASIRMPIIRHSTTVAKRRSIRDRPVAQSVALQQMGHRIHILHLQGPLFFGSVEQMIQHLRGITARQKDVHAVIIDFAEVLNFDSAACAALEKLLHLLQAQSVSAHLANLSPDLSALFVKWGLPMVAGNLPANGVAYRVWTDLESAIAQSETQLLDDLGLSAEDIDIARMLFDLGRRHPRTPDLMALMKSQELKPGEHLIRASENTGDVFFIVAGRFGVHLPTDTGGMVRIRVMGPGTVVGEIAYMTGQARNADVICEEASAVLCLSAAVIQRIEAEDRDLAALMMSVFSRGLAVKLAQSNTLLTYRFAETESLRGG